MIKNCLITVSILLFVPFGLLSQDGGINFRDAMLNPNSNFHEISEKTDAFFNTNPNSDEGGSYAQYKRWKMFWQNRVDKPNGAIGSFVHSQQALNSLMNNSVCASSNYSSWKLLGPNMNMPSSNSWPNLGRVMAIASDPNNSNIIYAGSEAGGVFKTTNGLSGSPRWTNITNSLRLPGLGINDIKIDPTNSQTIYVATGNSASGGYGIGILKSVDAGVTWGSISPISPAINQIVRKIAINPINPSIVYTLINDAVYKTTDGGTNWNNVFTLPNSVGDVAYDSNLIARHFHDIEIHPTNPSIVYVVSDDHAGALSGFYSTGQNQYGGNDGLLMYKTTDGFSSPPTLVNIASTPTGEIPSIRMSIAVTPAEPNSIYAIFKNYSNSQYTSNSNIQFYKSIDMGANWSLISTPNNLGNAVNEHYNDLVVSPTDPNIIYTLAQEYPYKSINGGVSFVSQPAGQHIDCRIIEIFSGSTIGTLGANDYLIYGNDGGISLTIQGGSTWNSANGTGLVMTEYYGVGSSENSPRVAGGTQDNDVSIYDGNNDSWILPYLSQDGGDVMFDKNDPNILYAQKWCCGPGSEGIHKYVYNGSNWVNNGNFKPVGDGPNVRAMLMDDNDYLYIGYQNVHKILTPNVSSGGWTQISDFSNNFTATWGDLKAVEVSLSDSNTIYAAFPRICYGCGTPGNEGVLFKTTTGGGMSANDWQNITGNLPSIIPQWLPISDIVIDPNNNQRLWITIGGFKENSSISGIYNGDYRVVKSEDGGQTWADFSDGLTQFPVNDIKYHRGSDDGLYIATDVGVFYRNASMSQWECFNNGFPVCVVTDLDISSCQGKVIASTYGRGMWSADLAPVNYTTEIVNVNSYWNDEVIYRNISVENNSVLDISGGLSITSTLLDVAVENGSVLNVNGATITYCQCPSLVFNINGEMNINNTTLNFPGNTVFNIDETGIVNINSPEGLCLNLNTQFTILPGGNFFINGQDYTSNLVNFLNNYDKYISNQNITGNHYVLNKIETSGNVQNQGVTNLKAGREIVFKPGFIGNPGLVAEIDKNINSNCEGCISQGSQLRLSRPSLPTNNNTSTTTNNKTTNTLEQANTNLYQIKIFPNPNSGVFTLNISAIDKKLNSVKDNEQFKIIIINGMGKKLFEKQVNTLNNNIDISNISKGIYYVNVVAIESGNKMAEAIIIR